MNMWMGLSRKIDAFSRRVGIIFSYLMIPLVILIVYEVVTRSFRRPTVWSFEMSNFLYGAHFMLVAAYGLLTKSHVAIDIVSGRLSKKAQAVLSLICYFCMYFPFIIVFLYYGWSYAANSWQMLEKSWSIWGPPLYPFKTVLPVTAAMLLLQGISEVIKDIDVLFKKGK